MLKKLMNVLKSGILKRTSLTSYFNSSVFCSRRLCREAQQADWAWEPQEQEVVY